MRPPSTRWRAPTSSDLPAPVSPVSTFRPGPNRTSTWSTTAKPVMRKVVSMGRSVPPTPDTAQAFR